MINLLLVDINEVNGNIIQKAVQEIKVDNLYFITAQEKQREIFEKYGTCYSLGNIVQGKYTEEELDYEHCIPLEDAIFDYMNPFLLEILNQQRRYEQHFAFTASNKWEDHYNTYMKNLFFFYNLLKGKNITHIFFYRLPHQGYDAILYHLAKMMNIPVVAAFASLIPKRDYVFSDYMTVDEDIAKEFERLKIEYKDATVDEIELEGSTKEEFDKWTSLDPVKMKPFYMNGDKMRKTFYARYGTTNLINAWRAILGKEYEKYGANIKFISASIGKIPTLLATIPKTYKNWRHVKPHWKETKKVKAFYEAAATMPKEGEKYIYFALHYQPEATSNPLGKGAYCDQRVPLQILSRSLPKDIKIYVKAHPDQLAFFSGVDYYKDMLRMPQVKLMKMECSTYELIKNAYAVASLTGTACWESQFYGVPAILFGYSYKNASPLSYHVRTVEECKQVIQDITNNKKTATLKELKLYTKAAHNLSFPIEERDIVFPQMIKELIGQA